LDTFVSTIMNKPKPKAAAPAPKEEPKKEDSAPKEETAEPTEKKEADMDVEQ
jgi:ribosomal protein L12E/L44/L45/RPP1/RPP2